MMVSNLTRRSFCKIMTDSETRNFSPSLACYSSSYISGTALWTLIFLGTGWSRFVGVTCCDA
ncbi:hypothetical protein L873DRAFT_1743871 [Choiromyces venosus 120613-1]|uniref:Uncharacterized protein n=1 Tax=Choiromyces venosus 120613-1 TaxID=1336337 RepID=A0A3N4JIV7_9PEZI|nr:hypothetical protein L873DRAFT_1743871 [Choiromyces venosus 120613-1]